MADILLKRDGSPSATYVPNSFIDKYMTNADGEFVKIYLYLLRCINSPELSFSISGIADKFDYTEKDVKRALKYWEKMHLLRLEFNKNNELAEICMTDTVSAAASSQAPVLSEPPVSYDAGSRNTAAAQKPVSSCILYERDCSTPAVTESEKIIPYNPPVESLKDHSHILYAAEPARDNSQIIYTAEPVRFSTTAPKTADLAVTQPIQQAVRAEHPLTQFQTDEQAVPQPMRQAVHTEHPLTQFQTDEQAVPQPMRQAVHTEHPLTQFQTDEQAVPQLIQQAVHTEHPLTQFQADENVQELLYVAERYLGHQLNHTETEKILYWMDELHFSQDLIDYLIEQCVAKNRPSIQYMDKVALDWAARNVHTLSEAKQALAEHNMTVYVVRKAFGISDRNLGDFELEYVQTWSGSMGFSDEVIALACQKTLSSTQKISFQYANTILENWQNQNVQTKEEIEALDAKRQKMQAKKYAAAKKAAVQASIQASVRTSKNASCNNYNNFSQRTYDYDALERELLTR